MKKFILLSSILAASLMLSACAIRSHQYVMDNMMIQNDEDFISMMIPHHQEAINTAEIILAQSENSDLKIMAQDIVEAQTTEISQMEAWGKDWFGNDFKPSDNYKDMMPELSTLKGKKLDQAFIEGMIEHHQMAIIMAREIQAITKRHELFEMANSIIDAQSTEIETMNRWLLGSSTLLLALSPF